jgi:hypothetical protein
MQDLQKATQQQSMIVNSRMVLRVIYDRGVINRAGPARRTDLTELQER